MATRQTIWAQRKRRWLLAVLGGRCVHCGCADNLTFDCITATGDKHHKMSSAQRMTFYTRQAAMGNLQVLCFECNCKKSFHRQARYQVRIPILFREGVRTVPTGR